jgi:phosphohistidine phosphatase SixA
MFQFLVSGAGRKRGTARIIQQCWRSADTLSQAFGASPFRPRSMDLYLVGHHPIRSNGAYFLPSGPERNLNVSLSPASMARPSARGRESSGAAFLS